MRWNAKNVRKLAPTVLIDWTMIHGPHRTGKEGHYESPS